MSLEASNYYLILVREIQQLSVGNFLDHSALSEPLLFLLKPVDNFHMKPFISFFAPHVEEKQLHVWSLEHS